MSPGNGYQKGIVMSEIARNRTSVDPGSSIDELDLLRSVFDLSGDAIFILDGEGRFLEANKVACDRYGFTRDEFRRINVSQVNAQDQARHVSERIAKVKSEGGAFFETVHRSKNGRLIPTEVNSRLIRRGGATFLVSICRDISGRKQVENKLAQLAAIVESSEDAIIAKDLDGAIISWNFGATKLYGHSAGEAIGKSISILTPKGVSDETREILERIKRGETVKHYETTRVGRDGKNIEVSLSVSPIRDPDGTIVGASTIARDIRDRKRAEAALRKKEEEFETILRTATDGFWITDCRGRFLEVNDAVCRNLGYSRDELLRMSVSDIEALEKQEEIVRRIRQIMEKGSDRFEGKHRRKDGTMLDVEISVNYITSPNECFFAFLRDNTERKRAEGILHMASAYNRSLIEASLDPLVTIDASGKITDVNIATEKVTGYPREHLIGTDFSDYFTDPERARTGYQKVFREGSVQDYALEIRGRGGLVTPVLYNASVYRDNSGNIIGVFAAARDITERVRAEAERLRLEEQVRHAQKLESLGILAGGIAHDFNNILMAIMGHADLAQSKLSNVSPVRIHLLEIEKATRRAADLCRQMLAYSGKGRFLVESLDLNELIKDMGHMLAMSVSKKAALQYDFLPDLPRIDADAAQIRQVVMNLVINASEAIGNSSGAIAVATGAMQCGRDLLREIRPDAELPEGLYVSLEVADTGAGMDEPTLRKIFDPFFTTKFTGRGLGLAAVLGIVRGHGGVIQVASEPGRGSTFKVLLPASAKASAVAASEETPEAGWLGTGTILLADDEETVRRVGVDMLESLGFRVLAAADGQEAVGIFRERSEEIAGVILDLTMPRMDGEEAFREIRRIRPDVRVILTSGYNEQQTIRRFVGEGLAGFIQKPFKLIDLSTMLRQVLRSR